MSPSFRSIVLALVLAAVLSPTAAQASPQQMSIMMDDDLLVYRSDAIAARTPDADEGARRRHDPRDGPVGDGRGVLEVHEGRPGQAQGQEEHPCPRSGTAPEPALQARQSVDLPDPQLGPLRQPRARRDRTWDPRVLQHHRTRSEVGARQEAEGIDCPSAELQAARARVQAVRDGCRQALRWHLQGRERLAVGAAARQHVVAVERAQPGGLAVSAVGERAGPPRRRCTARCTRWATRASSRPGTASTTTSS